MPLRVLDEAEFWKHQEEEHTVVIRELVTDLEEKYVDLLKEWEQALSDTHQQVERYIQTVIRSGNVVTPPLYEDVLEMVSFCLEQSNSLSICAGKSKRKVKSSKIIKLQKLSLIILSWNPNISWALHKPFYIKNRKRKSLGTNF